MADSASGTDWIARGIGAGGVLISLATLAYSRIDNRWKRRHAGMTRLRPHFEDLEAPVLQYTDSAVLESIFSVTAGFAVSEMQDGIRQVPDFRFRRWVTKFASLIADVRGANDPSSAARTPAQLQKLSQARKLALKIRKRFDKAARKGNF